MVLNIPEVKENIGSIQYLFEDLGLKVNVERMSNEGKAELWVFSLNGKDGSYKLLHTASTNLMSTSTMNGLAKRLKEHSEKISWTDLLTYITAKTMEIVRRGEPVREIGMKPEQMKLEYTCFPILEKGQPTTIYGPGGNGKSYLAEYIGCLVQFNVCGVHGWIPSAGNVLYLDWESDYEVHTRRTWAIKKGLGIDTEATFLYRYCSQPLVHDIDQIRRLVSENNIELAIIDSQMAASSHVPGDPSVAIAQFYGALRSLRCTTLTIDHQNKEGELYGSIAKTNRSRSQFELQKSQEPDETFIELALIHRKHNEGKHLKSIGIKMNFLEDQEGNLEEVKFQDCEVANIHKLSETASTLKDRVLNHLKSGATTAEDINESLSGTSLNGIRVALTRLKKNDKVAKLDNQRWGLIYND